MNQKEKTLKTTSLLFSLFPLQIREGLRYSHECMFVPIHLSVGVCLKPSVPH